MAMNRPRESRAVEAGTFSRWRRWLSHLNLLVIAVLSVYILILINLVVYRHPWRSDFTIEKLHTLSASTRQRLELVSERIRVIAPIFFQVDNPVHGMQREIFLRAHQLLKEYESLQPQIVVEDPLSLSSQDDALKWKRIRDEMMLGEGDINRFIFLAGDEGQYRQLVAFDDLAHYDRPQSRLDRKPPKIHRFLGEKVFTQAITRILRRERKVIYFTMDHGESSLADEGQTGLSILQQELEADGYTVRPMSLFQEEVIPDDCELLVIFSPDDRFSSSDRALVQDYLTERDGKLLVTLGPLETGIEELLAEWGLGTPKGQIYQRQKLGKWAYWSNVVGTRQFNALHPVTERFQSGGFEIVGSFVRPLDPEGRRAYSGEYLVQTPIEPASFIDTNSNGQFDPGERTGRIIFGASVHQPRPESVPPDYVDRRTRIVAIGDGSPFTNVWIGRSSHRDLILNAVRWLLEQEEEVVGGEGSEWKERRIAMTPRIEDLLFYIPIFLFPGLVLAAGAFVYFVRRS